MPTDPTRAVVLGEIPHGLVPVLRPDAERLAALRRALAQAETWGDLRDRLSPENLSALNERMADDWDEAGGPPPDDQPFQPGQISGHDDGDWPEWPPQTALEWVPESVYALGREVATMLNGEYLEIAPAQADALVAALEAAGYTVEWDRPLVDAACGGYNVDLTADA